MKKILAFLLAGCLALSLTACGQEPADQTDPAEETVYPACFDGMEDLIAAARAEGAQLVIVYVHWGQEHEYDITEGQQTAGRAAIDAGADLVVGSHPHVVQGWEVYQGRYLVYSLGNFCFGGNTNPDDKDCLIFQQTFTVTGDEVAKNDDVDFIAASVSTETDRNTYQPVLAEGDEKARIDAKVQEAADRIAAAS